MQCDDGGWDVHGMMDVEDFENTLGPSGMGDNMGFHTVAGFVVRQIEHTPQTGEQVCWNDIGFTVAGMDGHRIDQLRDAPPPAAPARDAAARAVDLSSPLRRGGDA